MDKLYKSALFCGLIPLLLLAAMLLFKLSSPTEELETLITATLIASVIIILIGFGIIYSFYSNARKRQSQRNLARAIIPFSLLVINIPLAGITLFAHQYTKISNTITIENNSAKTVKKMFLSIGSENYFIEPVEPGETLTRAIVFNTDGEVRYKFNLDNEVFSGVLFKNNKSDSSSSAKMTITRTERILVNESQ